MLNYYFLKLISYLEESWAAINLLGMYESNKDLGSDEPTWFCSGIDSSFCAGTGDRDVAPDLKSCGGIWGGTKSAFGPSESFYKKCIFIRKIFHSRGNLHIFNVVKICEILFKFNPFNSKLLKYKIRIQIYFTNKFSFFFKIHIYITNYQFKKIYNICKIRTAYLK